MESKKINQLATNVSPQTSDLTIIGDPTTGVSKKITLLQIANLFATTGTVTSVAVTETGDALTITGSPITSAGTINIGFAGDATQYVRGDGALADFPTSTGGGSSVSYYLNSSVSQGTIGGVAYRELSKDPIIGAGTDITISADGYIASYITDANDPALLEVPGGNFNCEFYFSVNSNAHNPYVYAELYKYDGSTFTLLGSSQSVPEYLSNGTTLSPYYFAIPVAASALTITDRLAVRIYANVDTRVVTLHTENSHLCQVVTTFSKGLTTLNSLTRQTQFFATGTSGTDFNISSVTATHTFNIPDASATNRGLITTGSQTIAGDKTINGNTDFVGNSNFSGYAIFSNAIPTQINYGAKIAKGSVPATFGSDAVNLYSDATTNNIIFRDNLSKAKLIFNNSTQTFTFPAATGTLALTSDLSSYVPYTGATGSVDLGINDLSSRYLFANGNGSASGILAMKISTTVTATSGYGTIGAISGQQFAFVSYLASNYNKIAYFNLSGLSDSTVRTFTLPDATGTLALTSQLTSGTVTSVAALTLGTSGTDLSSSVANGTTTPVITLNVPTASATNRGALSSADWTTFNGKQSALTNPVTGTGTSGQVTYFNGTSTVVGSSNHFWDATNNRLGINQATPLYSLDVSGTGRFTSTLLVSGALTSGQGKFWDGTQGMFIGAFTGGSGFGALYSTGITPSGSNYSLAIAATETDLSVPTGGTLNLQIGSANKLTISSAGNVGINNSSPAAKLDITASNSSGAGNVYVGNSSNLNLLYASAPNFTVGINAANGGSVENVRFYNAGTTVGTISTTGSLTSYNVTSDYRLKEDFKDYNALSLISEIKTYDYQWKSDKTRMYGVIAHELQEVIPYIVFGEKDGEDMQSVDYSKLTPILLKAIQEQQIQIQNLQEQINILSK